MTTLQTEKPNFLYNLAKETIPEETIAEEKDTDIKPNLSQIKSAETVKLNNSSILIKQAEFGHNKGDLVNKENLFGFNCNQNDTQQNRLESKQLIAPNRNIHEILQRSFKNHEYNFSSFNYSGVLGHDNKFSEFQNTNKHQYKSILQIQEPYNNTYFQQDLINNKENSGILISDKPGTNNSYKNDQNQMLFSSPPSKIKKSHQILIKQRNEQIKNTPDPNFKSTTQQHIFKNNKNENSSHFDLNPDRNNNFLCSDTSFDIQNNLKSYHNYPIVAKNEELCCNQELLNLQSENETCKFNVLKNVSETITFNNQKMVHQGVYDLDMVDSINPSFGIKSQTSQDFSNSLSMKDFQLGILNQKSNITTNSCTNLLNNKLCQRESIVDKSEKENLDDSNTFKIDKNINKKSQSSKCLVPRLNIAQIIE